MTAEVSDFGDTEAFPPHFVTFAEKALSPMVPRVCKQRHRTEPKGLSTMVKALSTTIRAQM
jgi:hypothetical protein